MYPLVNIPSNLFSAAAAAVVAIVTRQATSVVATAAVTEVNSTFVYGFTGCCLAVSAMLFMVVFLYYQLQTNYNSTSDNKTAKKKKPKISLSYIESLKIIWNDRCLLSLSLMTFFYGLCLNVIEVQWKDSLKLWSGANYTSNYSQFFLYSNIFSALITALTRNTLSRYGWKISALVTPVSILITGSLFYIFLMINNIGGGYFANLIISPLLISVMVGGLQNMISKATKYTLFDSTRELAYKTLPRENQSIGKSIIDVVIGRSSKASGSAVQYSLMNYMVPFIIGSNVPVSLRAIVPYSFVIVLIGCITWISATLYLAHQYENTDPSETAKLTPFSSVIDYYQTKMLLSPDDASIKAEFKTIYDTYYAEAAASQFEKVKKLAAIHHHQEELKNNL
jgi:AAA family ATP:ADP antiporter